VRRAEVASAAERRLVWGENVWIRQVDKKKHTRVGGGERYGCA